VAGWLGGFGVNPAHVAEQRRVAGRRRVKTDAIDLEAITELVLAGRGRVITDREVCIGELVAWASHRSRIASGFTAGCLAPRPPIPRARRREDPRPRPRHRTRYEDY
jgi:hypothetical protein